MILHHTCDTM